MLACAPFLLLTEHAHHPHPAGLPSCAALCAVSTLFLLRSGLSRASQPQQSIAGIAPNQTEYCAHGLGPLVPTLLPGAVPLNLCIYKCVYSWVVALFSEEGIGWKHCVQSLWDSLPSCPVVSLLTLGTLGHFSAMQVMLGGQPGTDQQRSGPSFLTSKPPVLLAVSSKLLLLCSPCLQALCPLPFCLCSPVLTLSPACAFTSLSASAPSVLLVSLARYIILSLLFSKATLIRGWWFPFLLQKTGSSAVLSRRLCPQSLCLLCSAQPSGPFHLFPARLRPWNPSSTHLMLLAAPVAAEAPGLSGEMPGGDFHISVCPLCTMLHPIVGK